jgi:hypothetical protein
LLANGAFPSRTVPKPTRSAWPERESVSGHDVLSVIDL